MPDPVVRPTGAPDPTRREFLVRSAAVGGLAFGLRGLPLPLSDAKAQSVLEIFLQGGLSHLDSFDPKPDAPVEVRGPFGTVASKLDGEPLSGLLPQTARVADRLVIVRSMTHGEAAHERGTHGMLTGFQPSPAIVYPSFGAVVSHELGSRADLPAYVCVPNASEPFLGTGYLSSAFGAFSLGGEPAAGDFRVRDLSMPKGVDAARAERRRRILTELDGAHPGTFESDAVDATAAFYEQAWKLVESEAAQDAFRIDKEPPELRDRYGRTRIGQRLLLARRLVRSGVRFVTVLDGGYDTHRNIAGTLRPRLRELDQAFASLIADLDAEGLLATTLVLLTTEFGRTSRINPDAGRDHWPRAFSVVLAGGGLKRGLALGRTDASASEPVDDPVGPADLARTVFTQLGIDPDKRLMSPGDRPIDIVRGGRVLGEILA
jgi:hypothetical protein